jgi:hypothetical protein
MGALAGAEEEEAGRADVTVMPSLDRVDRRAGDLLSPEERDEEDEIVFRDEVKEDERP